MTDLWVLIDWFFYGFIRYVIFWIPLLTPPSVDRDWPWQWFRYNSVDDWWHKNDNNGGPDEHWLQCWFRMLAGESLENATEHARRLVNESVDLIQSWIGGISGRFATLGAWIDYIERFVGFWLPDWAGSVIDGLNRLWGWLPGGIREGLIDWQGIWNNIVAYVRDWAIARYDAARSIAHDAWSWVLDRGESLARWRDSVSGWIDAFRADPVGIVTGWLGEPWLWLVRFRYGGRAQVLAWLGPDIDKLLTFGADCVSFYYALWQTGWQELGEFVSDPRSWLIDRIEQVLVERW